MEYLFVILNDLIFQNKIYSIPFFELPVLLCDSNMTVTKTNLANSYIKGKPVIEGEYSELLVGFKESIKAIKFPDKILFLNLIECPNDIDQFLKFSFIIHNINKKDYKIIFGYDITNPKGFIEIEEEWAPECKDIIFKENVRVYLVGNKLDIQTEKKVSKKDADWKNSSFKYFEISRKAYLNIKELFEDNTKNGEAYSPKKEELKGYDS